MTSFQATKCDPLQAAAIREERAAQHRREAMAQGEGFVFSWGSRLDMKTCEKNRLKVKRC